MIRIRHEFIEKGKPQQNGFSESFNARFGMNVLECSISTSFEHRL
ncbi:MAG: integrase core domain-containing protein [Mesotoga sp.]